MPMPHDIMEVDDEYQPSSSKTNGAFAPQSSSFSYNPEKNSHLKGRKRFIADLADLKDETKNGLTIQGLFAKKVRPGDDEGSIEFLVEYKSTNVQFAINLLISDPSEYPKSHSCFGYSPDADSPRVSEVLEDIASESPRPIRDTIERLLKSLSKVLIIKKPTVADESESEMDEDGSSMAADDYEVFSDLGEFHGEGSKVEEHDKLAALQRDFVEVVASSYRPGFVRVSGDDFVLSVSLPVIKLAESIPPRALMAWDRRLLSRSQHLVLLISGFHSVYPPLESDGTYTSFSTRLGVNITFKVGLSGRYKPSKEHVQESARKHGLIIQDAEDELRIQAEKEADERAQQMFDMDDENEAVPEPEVAVADEEEEDAGRFETFSLSSSLESLLEQSFLKILQLRKKFGLGWAGAELLHSEIEKSQMMDETVYTKMKKDFIAADKSEFHQQRTTILPLDPLGGQGKTDAINLPLTAFSYLIRRLSLCTKYCIVCHNKLNSDYEALKPYVCDSKLCSYQYFSLNRGPSLEYEIIHNPVTVDLLVSLAYVSAAEEAMDDPLPVGLGLRVPPSQNQTSTNALVDFDDLDLLQMRKAIVQLIDSLPPIQDMKKHLQRKVRAGKSKPKLKDCDPSVLPAAWTLLRWCVASCTAHLEDITSEEESIHPLESKYRQFRLTVGAPHAEAKFKSAIVEAQNSNNLLKQYPVLYAFHGSPLKNWHSIIRHGLWFKTIAHGRAYGHGVYLAKDGNVSMGTYAVTARTTWNKSQILPSSCTALVEVVNLPDQFVSHNPYYVVQHTHWLMCRYLLVRGTEREPTNSSPTDKIPPKIPTVKLKDSPVIGNKSVQIPDPAYHVEMLLNARTAEYVEENPDDEDLEVFELQLQPLQEDVKRPVDVIVIDDSDDDYKIQPQKKQKAPSKPRNDWKHDPDWVNKAVPNLLPPPEDASPGATMAVQRELKATLREQEKAASLRELGWYMPPDLIGDNLFQWIVEMHSFDPDIPIAKDLKAKKVNSLIFEIRFPPTFPIAPPFFRILTPRFLPFIHGGGGHVTGGGSICMDLLTADGWLPSYSIPAVLLQIKLAISNLDPRPARLAKNWDQPYHVSEALAGYKRAAATHGWQVPAGLDRMLAT
ncbi:hypothetical protein BDQ17DRAFT_1351337 [Cyathus striatus]|nr:hypothetical protein BDQ17DRAFT_1351337 [Cyathus striatus]